MSTHFDIVDVITSVFKRIDGARVCGLRECKKGVIRGVGCVLRDLVESACRLTGLRLLLTDFPPSQSLMDQSADEVR